ncbi:ABC transporter permease [Thermophilibacter mediterraneus]|uniref:ABC transporter permease n=1 Tax=Thermophilibacter mediterraneus TaxID=1871031 RepID=UPI002354F38F|nr:ABC transporter permease [Thermophilibacter mediterraneus]
MPLATIAVLLVVWQAAVVTGLVPNFLLPTPVQVVQALAEDAALLASHCVTTLAEAAAGLAAGVALGFAFAVLMDRFEGFYLAFEPLMTISQTIPTVAIAPLLVLWLGYGALPKVVLVIVSTFFPITVSLVSGFRSVDPDVIDLMRTMNASRWQIFWYAKLPAAAEQFFSGLKISATYAIVGAVIAEWLGGNEGLGVYMTRVRKSFSYDRMFAAIIVISALSLALMKVVELVQRLCMPWKRAERKSNER